MKKYKPIIRLFLGTILAIMIVTCPYDPKSPIGVFVIIVTIALIVLVVFLWRKNLK